MKAFEELNEEALLDLIEGQLSPEEAGALRRAIEANPAAAAQIEAMVKDRAVLRSIESPQPPRDLLSRIEPMLARPLLMEPRRSKKLDLRHAGLASPGGFRRQHHRERWARRWRRRLAVAAGLLVVLGAGMWAAGMLAPALWQSAQDRLASRADSVGEQGGVQTRRQAPDGASVALAPTVSAEGTIHHAVPIDRLAGSPPPAAGMGGAMTSQPSQRSTDEMAPVIASFAVVLYSDAPEKSERRMIETLAGIGEPAALVRNFNYREAEQIEQRMLAAAGRDARDRVQYEAAMSPSRSAPAGASDERIRRLAEHVRRHIGEALPETAAADSAHLHGRRDLAPTYEQQLALSSRGASHALGVRASALATVLQRLHERAGAQGGESIVLRDFGAEKAVAEPAAARSESGALKDWVKRRQTVRRFIDEMAAGGDPIVLVPLTINGH